MGLWHWYVITREFSIYGVLSTEPMVVLKLLSRAREVRTLHKNHYGLLTGGVGYSFRPQSAYEYPTWYWHKHVTFHNKQIFTKITELIKLQLNYNVK